MWLFVFYFLIILLGLTLKIKSPQSKLIQYFRAFYPSWKFFENTGDHFDFYVMSDHDQKWHEVPFQMSPQAFRLIFNPLGNDLLARRSLLEHLVQDLQNLKSASEVENLVSFQLVKNLARFEVHAMEPNTLKYRFKIMLNHQEDILTSDWVANV